MHYTPTKAISVIASSMSDRALCSVTNGLYYRDPFFISVNAMVEIIKYHLFPEYIIAYINTLLNK